MSSSSSADALFQPFKVGASELKHRVVYAPLTRCRAIGTVPIPEMALYYSQRATDGGLMIAEATCIMPQAHGCVASHVFFYHQIIGALGGRVASHRFPVACLRCQGLVSHPPTLIHTP